MGLSNTEKRKKVAEIEQKCDDCCDARLISQYSETELGEFVPEAEVTKLQAVNSAINYLQGIWGDAGKHELYTKILVDYIEELEAQVSTEPQATNVPEEPKPFLCPTCNCYEDALESDFAIPYCAYAGIFTCGCTSCRYYSPKKNIEDTKGEQ